MQQVTIKNLYVLLQIAMTLIFIVLMVLNILYFVFLFNHDQSFRESTVVYTPINIASSVGLYLATMLLVLVVYQLIKKQAEFNLHDSQQIRTTRLTIRESQTQNDAFQQEQETRTEGGSNYSADSDFQIPYLILRSKS